MTERKKARKEEKKEGKKEERKIVSLISWFPPHFGMKGDKKSHPTPKMNYAPLRDQKYPR